MPKPLMVSSLEIRGITAAWWKVFPEGDVLAAKYLEDLFERYSETHRFYHTLEHIHEALYESLVCAQRGTVDRKIVIAAILFHDIVYNPRAKGGMNEADSTLYAINVMKRFNINDFFIRQVAACIRETATHNPTFLESTVVSDADMFILASNRNRYFRYVQDVRREYAFLSDSQFIDGRVAWINSVLESDKPIFRTSTMKDFQYEAHARHNLAEELDSYGAKVG